MSRELGILRIERDTLLELVDSLTRERDRYRAGANDIMDMILAAEEHGDELCPEEIMTSCRIALGLLHEKKISSED